MAKGDSKSYDPASVEAGILDTWMKEGHFRAAPDDRAERFCMVIPPPNVTGVLHLGHALNNTIHDILIRRERMKGKNTYWLVGTDHAGIATQAKVESTIRKEEGKTRHELGRDELVRRIWDWKHQYGGRIVEQLKLMGCSCDYDRERFTLDEGCAKAVRETFFKLFRDGLIYRGKRLVNWDTQLQTAVSDDEVYHETVKGHFYHFKYPIIDPQPGEPEFVHIATTRPETMLGDTAVAVHPDPEAAIDKAERTFKEKLASASEKEKSAIQASLDELAVRRKTLLPTLVKLRDMAGAGRTVRLPLVDREIPLICDIWAKPELGSGCVKVTPAHDPNDYDVAKRHDLPLINVMTVDGKVAEIVELDGQVNADSSKYEGLRFATMARKKVVEDLEAAGLVEKIEDRMIEIGHSDRSNAPIEPFMSDQWFVRMGDLDAEQAAKVQSPFLKQYIESHAKSEPRPSGSGDAAPTCPGLAQMAIDAVEQGKVQFHPARYAKTYLDWLGEKRDWCISRQLWWGHRIPIWSVLLNIGGVVDEEYRRKREATVRNAETSLRQFLAKAGAGNDDYFIKREQEWSWRVCARSSIAYSALSALEEWMKSYKPQKIQDGQPLKSVLMYVPGFEDATSAASDLFKHVIKFVQDPDVLDTWFSSALWPHSTLGWPEEDDTSGDAVGGAAAARAEARGSPDKSLLEYYYPTNVLSTAREIITLWVARMVMTGLYNMGEIPFTDVVSHPVIQDGQGRRMSKSLGNGVDPVDIIDKYGADALRFTLTDLATETQDIRMPVAREKLPDGREINTSPKFEKGRNFCNKLWQAATGYVLPNLEGYAPQALEVRSLRLEDRWILSRLNHCIKELDAALSQFRFSEAINALYHFMWDDYCSDYIEMTKSRLAGEERSSAQQVLAFVLDRLLRVLHPFVPFVTEAIWPKLNAAAPRRGIAELHPAEPMLISALWPKADASHGDETVESQMASLQAVIKAGREIRTTVNAHRGQAKRPSIRSLPAAVVRTGEETCRLVDRYRSFVMPLAGFDALEVSRSAAKPHGALSKVTGAIEVYVPVADLIDIGTVIEAERKKCDELRAALERAEKQLANDNFIRRADPSIVEQARRRADDLSSQIQTIEQHLADLI